jgi:hypothetical protein
MAVKIHTVRYRSRKDRREVPVPLIEDPQWTGLRARMKPLANSGVIAYLDHSIIVEI